MIILGKAFVPALSGSSFSYGSFTAGERVLDSLQSSQNADVTQNYDSQGETVGFNVRNPVTSITINWRPAGGSVNTYAKAVEYFQHAPIGTIMMLSSSCAQLNGAFGYLGGSSTSETMGDNASISIPLQQFSSSAKTIQVMTPVS